jgi:type IV pilus assembly protein PilP
MERTRKQLRKSKLLAGSLALVFLLAVSATAAPAAAPPAAPAAAPATAVASAIPAAAPATVKPEEAAVEMPEYRYDPKGKTDPFKPFVRLELPTAVKKGPEKKKYTGNLTPLQRVSLDKVRVTGIAGSQAKRVAMVEDGAGKGYIVYLGTLIGENGGRVIQILPDRVIVEEKVGEGSKGKEKSHRVALKLHKEEGEGRP